MVVAGEVGGRWSGETQTFVQCLAQHKAKSAPKILQASAQVACYRRWSSLLSCSAAKAFATSLLERRSDPGAGGRVPSVHEVLGDARHAQCFWDEFYLTLILFAVKKKSPPTHATPPPPHTLPPPPPPPLEKNGRFWHR